MGATYFCGAGNSTAAPSWTRPIAPPWATTDSTCPSSSSAPASPEPDTAWYVLTVRRTSSASTCSGFSTGMAAMVVQLGLAMIPLGRSSIACGLTSLTTSGTSGSIRQALELSMTTAPASANRGAWAREPVAPAENSAIWMPAGSAVATSSTTISRPSTSIVEPAERAVANRRSSRIGNARSTRMSRITVPTWPVAPTTATENPESEKTVMVRFLGGAAPRDEASRQGAGERVPAILPAPRVP